MLIEQDPELKGLRMQPHACLLYDNNNRTGARQTSVSIYRIHTSREDKVAVCNILTARYESSNNAIVFIPQDTYHHMSQASKVNVHASQNAWTGDHQRITIQGIQDITATVMLKDKPIPLYSYLAAMKDTNNEALFVGLSGSPAAEDPIIELITLRDNATMAIDWARNAKTHIAAILAPHTDSASIFVEPPAAHPKYDKWPENGYQHNPNSNPPTSIAFPVYTAKSKSPAATKAVKRHKATGISYLSEDQQATIEVERAEQASFATTTSDTDNFSQHTGETRSYLSAASTRQHSPDHSVKSTLSFESQLSNLTAKHNKEMKALKTLLLATNAKYNDAVATLEQYAKILQVDIANSPHTKPVVNQIQSDAKTPVVTFDADTKAATGSSNVSLSMLRAPSSTLRAAVRAGKGSGRSRSGNQPHSSITVEIGPDYGNKQFPQPHTTTSNTKRDGKKRMLPEDDAMDIGQPIPITQTMNSMEIDDHNHVKSPTEHDSARTHQSQGRQIQ